MIAGGPTLFYDLNVAYDAGERRNPLRVMRELGIKWTRCEAEPIDQQIRFERCRDTRPDANLSENALR